MMGSHQQGNSTVERTNGDIVRAEEGDESVKELAEEAEEAKKELKESTTTGKKVQEESESDDKQ